MYFLSLSLDLNYPLKSIWHNTRVPPMSRNLALDSSAVPRLQCSPLRLRFRLLGANLSEIERVGLGSQEPLDEMKGDDDGP